MSLPDEGSVALRRTNANVPSAPSASLDILWPTQRRTTTFGIAIAGAIAQEETVASSASTFLQKDTPEAWTRR